jgi:adenine-specific DNA-methyltransferase
MYLDEAERNRRILSPLLPARQRSQLGQFMSPASVARFMAAMFPASTSGHCELLDAGAGMGALSCAFLDRWLAGGIEFSTVNVTAVEFDEILAGHLSKTLARYSAHPGCTTHVVRADFILQTVLELLGGERAGVYTHAILNPPYKKIANESIHRRALRQVGIETVNLYTAFVALAIERLLPGGHLVAIVPRSFCNGTYYQPFRELLLRKTAIRSLHLFDSRDSAFKDDEVLQENVVFMLEKGGRPGPVEVTTSTDDSFADLRSHVHAFDRIVSPTDSNFFIHIPTDARESILALAGGPNSSLDAIGLKVSTGPVVDFRLKAHLRAQSEPGTVPLLYPAHMSGRERIEWPLAESKKPNALVLDDEVYPWLMPMGHYCVVRRFSSKEERRRIVASVVRPEDFPATTEFLGLENHLNVFHAGRRGIDEFTACGLAVYLNTTAVDEAFRRFSGHTQVNAGDLRNMVYPDREALKRLGAWGRSNPDADQAAVDRQFADLIA